MGGGSVASFLATMMTPWRGTDRKFFQQYVAMCSLKTSYSYMKNAAGNPNPRAGGSRAWKRREWVGHDIGLMVAYAYAAQFPSETEKLVLMDAFLTSMESWEDVYDDPHIWHFRFNGPTPEALVRGRERVFRLLLE